MLQVMAELVASCRRHEFTDIIVLHEHRGEPDGLVVCHLPYGPTAYFGLHNTVRLHFNAGEHQQEKQQLLPFKPKACLLKLAA